MRYLAQYAQLEPTPKDWRRLESVKHVLLVSIRALPGETSCTPCEVGTMAAEKGLMECVPCRLGQYANATGRTFCHQCGYSMAPAQLRLWTTSQKVVQDDGEMWIQVQGATDESMCGCIPGTYLSPISSECDVCGVGSECPGSSKLVLLPGRVLSKVETKRMQRLPLSKPTL